MSLDVCCSVVCYLRASSSSSPWPECLPVVSSSLVCLLGHSPASLEHIVVSSVLLLCHWLCHWNTLAFFRAVILSPNYLVSLVSSRCRHRKTLLVPPRCHSPASSVFPLSRYVVIAGKHCGATSWSGLIIVIVIAGVLLVSPRSYFVDIAVTEVSPVCLRVAISLLSPEHTPYDYSVVIIVTRVLLVSLWNTLLMSVAGTRCCCLCTVSCSPL